MIRLQQRSLVTVADAQAALQTALQIEFATLPPYLYALYTIRPGTNEAAASRIKSIALQEMIHFCLDCNILNALGGSPVIAKTGVVPTYPGRLPGDIGGFPVHLYPFSLDAIKQGVAIETPDGGAIDFPNLKPLALATGPTWTIGEFYKHLDEDCLAKLPASAWHAGRNQINDAQYFAGDLFEINNYDDAHRAIFDIISEGEGAAQSPLDFQSKFAHFYTFDEIVRNRVLTKANNPQGFAWGDPLGVDWTGAFPAITDPSQHDFSKDSPAAQAAQAACNAQFSTMLSELQRAVNGEPARLGSAVHAMFALRLEALHALTIPLADGKSVAGPAFQFKASQV